MVRFGNQIRLAATDRERLRLLCDHAPPEGMNTVAAYNAFIDQQIACKSDATAEERLAKYLLGQLRQPHAGDSMTTGLRAVGDPAE